MFKKLRIFLLLFLLFIIIGDTWLTKLRSTDWDLPLRVVIYPIDVDGNNKTTDYIAQLTAASFSSIAEFMRAEATHFGIPLKQPLEIFLSSPVKAQPPMPPKDRSAVFNIMWWSLKLRYWAISNNNYEGPSPDIKLFIRYHDPKLHERLGHSLGLEKGLIGVVNGFADDEYTDQNQFVITHEILHTLGATDKYDLGTGQPSFPDGYADPEKQPTYPQEFAEIMGGRIPTSATESKMPNGLDETVIGPLTAKEINWIE